MKTETRYISPICVVPVTKRIIPISPVNNDIYIVLSILISHPDTHKEYHDYLTNRFINLPIANDSHIGIGVNQKILFPLYRIGSRLIRAIVKSNLFIEPWSD